MANTLAIRWDLTPEEAVALQQELRRRLVLEDDLRGPVTLVGGVDMSLRDEAATAAIAVFSFPELEPRAQTVAQVPLTFPYIPGLLAFREGPAIEAAWGRLTRDQQPDLLIFDGHGVAHPRGLGIASQMGLVFNRPSIGVAKSILVGRHEPVPDVAGAWKPLVHNGKIVGAALRLRPGAKPVFVSAGHRISLPTAIEFVRATARGYKLPEPTRWAHKLAGGASLPGLSEGRGASSTA